MPSLAAPAFPGDDGSADPAVVEALARPATHRLEALLAVLGAARLLVPIVAVTGADRAVGDKAADMAAVLTTGADGRTALLAFSGLASLQHWDPAARPVPVRAVDAARAALAEGASALVLDLAGPVPAVVETDDLRHLAAGDTLVGTAAGPAWVTRPVQDG